MDEPDYAALAHRMHHQQAVIRHHVRQCGACGNMARVDGACCPIGTALIARAAAAIGAYHAAWTAAHGPAHGMGERKNTGVKEEE